MLVDTHCHLGDERFAADRAAVIRRARAAGIEQIVVVADSADGSDRARDIAREFDLVATAGIHPHEAASWSPAAAGHIAAALDDPRIVAVGETGLDYHYDHAPRDAQRRAFEAQLALAARRRKPVVVHAREADDDVAALVREWSGRVPALVLHSFSSGPRLFDAGLQAGAYFSFSGMITFKTWQRPDHVVACPADRLLVETDAPYLAPVPHRGRRNEPAFVREVARRAAELRGTTLEQLAALTTANARRCFGLAPAADGAA